MNTVVKMASQRLVREDSDARVRVAESTSTGTTPYTNPGRQQSPARCGSYTGPYRLRIYRRSIVQKAPASAAFSTGSQREAVSLGEKDRTRRDNPGLAGISWRGRRSAPVSEGVGIPDRRLPKPNVRGPRASSWVLK